MKKFFNLLSLSLLILLFSCNVDNGFSTVKFMVPRPPEEVLKEKGISLLGNMPDKELIARCTLNFENKALKKQEKLFTEGAKGVQFQFDEVSAGRGYQVVFSVGYQHVKTKAYEEVWYGESLPFNVVGGREVTVPVGIRTIRNFAYLSYPFVKSVNTKQLDKVEDNFYPVDQRVIPMGARYSRVVEYRDKSYFIVDRALNLFSLSDAQIEAQGEQTFGNGRINLPSPVYAHNMPLYLKGDYLYYAGGPGEVLQVQLNIPDGTASRLGDVDPKLRGYGEIPFNRDTYKGDLAYFGLVGNKVITIYWDANDPNQLLYEYYKMVGDYIGAENNETFESLLESPRPLKIAKPKLIMPDSVEQGGLEKKESLPQFLFEYKGQCFYYINGVLYQFQLGQDCTKQLEIFPWHDAIYGMVPGDAFMRDGIIYILDQAHGLAAIDVSNGSLPAQPTRVMEFRSGVKLFYANSSLYIYDDEGHNFSLPAGKANLSQWPAKKMWTTDSIVIRQFDDKQKEIYYSELESSDYTDNRVDRTGVIKEGTRKLYYWTKGVEPKLWEPNLQNNPKRMLVPIEETVYFQIKAEGWEDSEVFSMETPFLIDANKANEKLTALTEKDIFKYAGVEVTMEAGPMSTVELVFYGELPEGKDEAFCNTVTDFINARNAFRPFHFCKSKINASQVAGLKTFPANSFASNRLEYFDTSFAYSTIEWIGPNCFTPLGSWYNQSPNSLEMWCNSNDFANPQNMTNWYWIDANSPTAEADWRAKKKGTWHGGSSSNPSDNRGSGAYSISYDMNARREKQNEFEGRYWYLDGEAKTLYLNYNEGLNYYSTEMSIDPDGSGVAMGMIDFKKKEYFDPIAWSNCMNAAHYSEMKAAGKEIRVINPYQPFEGALEAADWIDVQKIKTTGTRDSSVAENNSPVFYTQHIPELAYVPIPEGGIKYQATNADLQGSMTIVTIDQPFLVQKNEFTRSEWNEIVSWAAPMGYDSSLLAAVPTDGGRYIPVDNISNIQAMMACNLLTEWSNLMLGTNYECAYYTDETFTTPVRGALANSTEPSGAVVTNAYVKAGATGYRLPTVDEWCCAARWRGTNGTGSGAVENSNQGATAGYYWTNGTLVTNSENLNSNQNLAHFNSAQLMAAREKVGSGAATPYLETYDMCGNVAEIYLSKPDSTGKVNVQNVAYLGGKATDTDVNVNTYGPMSGTMPAEREAMVGFRLFRTLTAEEIAEIRQAASIPPSTM